MISPGRFDLQPNIREHNPIVKQDPTVFALEDENCAHTHVEVNTKCL